MTFGGLRGIGAIIGVIESFLRAAQDLKGAFGLIKCFRLDLP
jgi:hypothetical protein